MLWFGDQRDRRSHSADDDGRRARLTPEYLIVVIRRSAGNGISLNHALHRILEIDR